VVKFSVRDNPAYLGTVLLNLVQIINAQSPAKNAAESTHTQTGKLLNRYEDWITHPTIRTAVNAPTTRAISRFHLVTVVATIRPREVLGKFHGGTLERITLACPDHRRHQECEIQYE